MRWHSVVRVCVCVSVVGRTRSIEFDISRTRCCCHLEINASTYIFHFSVQRILVWFTMSYASGERTITTYE